MDCHISHSANMTVRDFNRMCGFYRDGYPLFGLLIWAGTEGTFYQGFLRSLVQPIKVGNRKEMSVLNTRYYFTGPAYIWGRSLSCPCQAYYTIAYNTTLEYIILEYNTIQYYLSFIVLTKYTKHKKIRTGVHLHNKYHLPIQISQVPCDYINLSFKWKICKFVKIKPHIKAL